MQFSRSTLHTQPETEGKLRQGGGEGTETKLGPSEIKKERGRRENTEGERERECPSNGYTQRGREKQKYRERERTSPWRICAIATQQGAMPEKVSSSSLD